MRIRPDAEPSRDKRRQKCWFRGDEEDLARRDECLHQVPPYRAGPGALYASAAGFLALPSCCSYLVFIAEPV